MPTFKRCEMKAAGEDDEDARDEDGDGPKRRDCVVSKKERQKIYIYLPMCILNR